MRASSASPFCSEPTSAIGPMQNSSDAFTKPSVNRPLPPSRRRAASPSAVSRSSIPSTSPTSAPAARLTSATMTPGSGPAWTPSSMRAIPSPTKSVTSPSTCISVRPSRSGRRAPARTPIAVPAATAATLIQVPDVRAKSSSMRCALTRPDPRRKRRPPGRGDGIRCDAVPSGPEPG